MNSYNKFILKSFKFTIKDNSLNNKNKDTIKEDNYLVEINLFDRNLKEISLKKDLPISILIGPNGAGKSFILRKIADAFRILEYYIEYKEVKSNYKNIFKKFNLEYFCNGKHYNIKFQDNKFIDFPNENALPKVILASSVLLNDKFLFQDNDKSYINDSAVDKKNTIYKYLGIKNTSNQASTNTFIKRTLESILRISNNNIKLDKVFKILGFEKIIRIEFKLKNVKTFFDYNNEINQEKLNNHFLNWNKRENNRKTVPYSYTKYLNLKNENENFALELSNFINYFKNKKNKKNEVIFDIDLSDLSDLQRMSLKEDYSYIEDLISLDLISSPTIKFIKNNNSYELDEISSGEYSFLFSMINLISYIESDSLIIVDEPEISLHPNWQIEYMNNLEEIFENYNSSHFIFATHSHFMISNIKSELSSVIKISDKGIRNNRNSYYGWSPENVLYNIFNMTTTRNHYFEMDIRKLINFISKNNSDNIEEIKDLVEKLEIFDFDNSDPLNELILEAKNFIKKFS